MTCHLLMVMLLLLPALTPLSARPGASDQPLERDDRVVGGTEVPQGETERPSGQTG